MLGVSAIHIETTLRIITILEDQEEEEDLEEDLVMELVVDLAVGT